MNIEQLKTLLPKYALPYRSPHAGGEKDLLATFYDDDRGTITVGFERCDGDTFNLYLNRSGLGESRFSRAELPRVLELAGILWRATVANGKPAARVPMKHLPANDVRADVQLQALATHLVNYANGNLDELRRMCRAIWPACEFYQGGTHLRVLIEGESNGKSFYVETV